VPRPFPPNEPRARPGRWPESTAHGRGELVEPAASPSAWRADNRPMAGTKRPRRSRRGVSRLNPDGYCHRSSTVNCPEPMDLAVQFVVLPASGAAAPVAKVALPAPEAVKPVTLPSANVSAIFPPESL
jgi:hypothetical protein